MICHSLNYLSKIQQAWSDGATPSIIPLNRLRNSDNKGCLANNGTSSVLIQVEPKTKLNWFILFWVCLESYQNQFYLIGMQKFANLKLDYGENMHMKTPVWLCCLNNGFHCLNNTTCISTTRISPTHIFTTLKQRY